jgi:CRP-like cAMP-binding protein
VGGRVGERAGAGLIKQTLSQTDLAQMANVSRQFANRALGGFVRHGWATVGYGCVAVTDVDALSAFAFGTVGAAALP